MVIQYTEDGQERSWSVNNWSVKATTMALNDSCGIPPEPMPQILTFVRSLFGETPEEFVNNWINEDCITVEDLFEMEPVEWFNKVISPILPEESGDIKITNVIFDEEEDLQEMVTSAGFQRMAPGKKQKMIIPSSKKALGKKNKYNTLGERKNEAYTGGGPKLSQTAYRDGYLAAKEGKDPIADNPYQDPYGYHYSQWEKGYMDYCHGKEMQESRSNRKPLKEEGDLNSVLSKLQRARGCVGVNGQLRYQYPNVCNSMAYLDEAIEELKNFMGL